MKLNGSIAILKKVAFLCPMLLAFGFAVAQTSNISGTINVYTAVTALDTAICPNKIVVTSTIGFSVGDSILIIQMKGVDFDSTNTSTFGNVNQLKGAGSYEIAKIIGITSNSLSVNGKLVNAYSVAGFIQVVKIPHYVNAIVTASLSCPPWNGQTGGVLILSVQNILQLNSNINVSGKGFRGGVISLNPDGLCGAGSPLYHYPLVQASPSWPSGGAEKGEGIGSISVSKKAGRGPLVTGGGGGNKHNTGGGGGSNFTAGGKGGDGLSGCGHTTGGLGGKDLSAFYLMNKLFLGGGGGCGDMNNGIGTTGESGGGIVIITAGSLLGNGFSILANGNSVTGIGGNSADGAGGGGGGGAIFLKTGPIISTLTAQACGGNGGSQSPGSYCVGPGGGGGSGIILTSLATLSGNSLSVTPGNPGIHLAGPCLNSPYGATAGSVNIAGILTGKNLIYTPNSNPSLTLTANSSQSVICSGNTVSLTVAGALNYTWLPVSSTGSMIVITPSASMVYTVVGTNTNNCSNSNTVAQVVNPNPILNTISNPSFICNSQSTSLSATGANNYIWQPGNLNGSVQIVSPGSTTNYTLTASNLFSCTTSAIVNVSVNPQPTLNVSVSNSLVCPNDVVSLSVSGAQSYTWSNSFNAASFTTVPVAPVVYTVTGLINGCTATASISVLAKPIPTISFNTFSITCASLGSATAIVSGGMGPFNYTWQPSNQNSAIASGLFPGTYTLQVYDQGTGCNFAPSTTFFPLVPLTATVVSSNSIVCNGIPTGTASVLLAGGSGTQSYTWSSASGTQFSSTVSTLAAGINTLNVIDGLTFCSVTQTFLITQPPALSLTISRSNSSICIGGSIQFTASMLGGTSPYTYTWLPSQIGASISVQNSVSGNYQYTVNSADANLCLASQTSIVSFVANPTLAVNNVSICPQEIATLQASGATSYTWNSLYAGNPYTVSPGNTTSYSVIGSSQSCTASAQPTVFVLPIPVALASNSGSVCTGQSLLLFGGGGTPFWTGPLSFTSAISNPTLFPTSAAQTGMYYLKVTAANGCTALASTQVTVAAVPFLSAAGSTVCEGSNALLFSNFFQGNQFLWLGPNSFSSTIQNPVITAASPSVAGTYSLLATAVNGCTITAIASVSVTSTPVFSIQNNSPLCENQTLQLNVGPSAYSYTWQTPWNSLYYSSQLVLTSMGPLNSGNYSLTVKSGPCVVQTLAPVHVNTLPGVSIINSGPVCESQTFSMNALGGNSYTWSGPGNFTHLQSGFTFTNTQPNQAGTYSVLVSDTNQCQNSAFDTLVVLQNPTPVVLNSSVCIGNTTTLSVSGGNSYFWIGPMGFTSSLSTVTISVPNASYSGQYSVITTGVNSCTVLSIAQLSAFPYPLPNIQISGKSTTCLHSSLSITASGGNQYTWWGPQSLKHHQAELNFVASTMNHAGIYTITVTNSNNCVSTSTVKVEVYDLPRGQITTPVKTGCEPFCCEFVLSSIGSTGSFIQAGYFIDGVYQQGPIVNHCFLNSGGRVVSAQFTDSNSCVNSASLSISIYPKPTAEFRYSPSEPKAGIDEVFFSNASFGIEQSEWTWYFMYPFSDTIPGEFASKLFEESGQYPVALMVKNTWGCMDTVIKVIHVEDDFSIYIPNSFTPNADGLNDLFQAKGTGFTSFTMEIYSRWGELIFTSNELQNGWDGNYKGAVPKNDVYVWKIQATTLSGIIKHITGQVTLIR